MRRALVPAFSMLLLAGCAVGPNYQTPTPPVGAGVFVEAPSSPPLPTRWWRLYDDSVLDRLVEEALTHNTDVRVAAANLTRARYILSEARAGLLPTTETQASYTYRRTGSASIGIGGLGAGSGTGTGTGTGGTGTGGGVGVPGTGGGATTTVTPNAFTNDFYSAGLNISYEADLFGRVSRGIEAARGDYQTAAAQLDAARVTVAAETARAYGAACGYAGQAAAARETLQLQARTLDLTVRLDEGGRGTQRDVAQARTLYEQAAADLPTFEGERRAALDALATLTGRAPSALDPTIGTCATPPRLTRPLPAGDGAALLARRPDIRQAERRLAAETARVGVATAELYPSISLLGAVSLGATRVGDLGKSQSLNYSIGPLISWSFPINGAARARLRQARANAEGALASFDGAILTALRETEQALARLDGEAKRNEALARAADAAARAAQLSRYRFDFGADSFLQLLDAERTRAQTTAALTESNSALIDNQVNLFRALGGGWEDAPEVAVPPDSQTARLRAADLRRATPEK